MLYTSRGKLGLNYILILESLNVCGGENILELMRFSNICKVLYMFLLKQKNKYTQCFLHLINVHILFKKKKKSWNSPNPVLEKYLK